MTTEKTNNRIAIQILSQLGGHKFISMTGADNLVDTNNGLQLKFKGSKIANHVRITLDVSDTYTVEFWKISMNANSVEMVKVYNNVYADMLQTIFTDFTGLDTSL